LAGKKKLKFLETLEYDHVGLPRGSSLCETLLVAAYNLEKPMKLRIQTTSFDGIRRMVASGLGISVLPTGSVLPFLDVEGLVACPLDETWAKRHFSLITRERNTLTRIAKLLVDHLLQAGQKADTRK
jgi:DNA-binding transcriptional LysR family regulator